jgi:hypothetical protein
MARRTFTPIASCSVNAHTSTTKTWDALTFIDVCKNSSSEHSQIKSLTLAKGEQILHLHLTHTHTPIQSSD